jgi:hypothetical protein
VDTIAAAWHGEGGSDLALALGRADSFRHARGGVVLTDRDVSGARVMWWPEHSTVKVEGRLSAMLAADQAVHDLSPVSRLVDAPAAAEAALLRLTAAAPAGDVAACRRLDLASERVFEDEGEAEAFIRAVALLTPAGRYKRELILGADGQAETGYVMTRSGVKLQRIYNKTREAHLDGPGVRVRIEAQNRLKKRDSKTFGQLASETVTPLAMRAWAGYAEQAEEVIVSNASGAVEQLAGRVASGTLTLRKAERMIGTLALLDRFGRAIYAERQGQRRLQDLRDEGVIVDEHLAPDRVVPVGQLLREMVDQFEEVG